jgi:hypothetical protein
MIQALKKEKIEFKFKELKNLHHKANIDCANFTVNEYQDEPSAKQYNHKSHSCGLKYEACVATFEDRIVWFEGPFLVSRHDLCVFRGAEEADTPDENCDPSALLWVMDSRLVGDSGYCGMPDKIVITKEEHSLDYKKFLGGIKTRGETLFKRLKSFAILRDRFHYGRGKVQRMAYHKMCSDACAVIVQYDYENGHPPFTVQIPRHP